MALRCRRQNGLLFAGHLAVDSMSRVADHQKPRKIMQLGASWCRAAQRDYAPVMVIENGSCVANRYIRSSQHLSTGTAFYSIELNIFVSCSSHNPMRVLRHPVAGIAGLAGCLMACASGSGLYVSRLERALFDLLTGPHETAVISQFPSSSIRKTRTHTHVSTRNMVWRS